MFPGRLRPLRVANKFRSPASFLAALVRGRQTFTYARARVEPPAFNRKPLKYVSGTAYRVSGTLSIGNSEQRIGDVNATNPQKSPTTRGM